MRSAVTSKGEWQFKNKIEEVASIFKDVDLETTKGERNKSNIEEANANDNEKKMSPVEPPINKGGKMSPVDQPTTSEEDK